MHPEQSRNRSELQRCFDQGTRIKYLFFWGHSSSGNSLGKECLSQWYPAAFHVDGLRYPSAEHYMMAGKAALFGDEEILQAILDCNHPREAKSLGRKVRGFDEARWLAHRMEITIQGNLYKFEQNQELREFLLQTRRRVLVEASPVDRIWGIGMDQAHPHVENPQRWNGENLLGFALMEVRSRIEGQVPP